MAGPLYKSLHFSYSNRRTNPNPLRPAQILQRHATVCVSDSVGTEAFKKFYKEEFLMRNLKKVLSLVLCVAMMLSVMVVGAGAAFSDQSKIKNTEAVDACTALNIIGGYPDGSFKPEGNITRAEVTKMICVALNGGKNPAVSTNTTPTFSDVRNNANAAWAEGYIESCAAQGIVSGVGGGKFAPNGNVTGVQLAKMLLVSLGYKSENEGFTGNAWATNVNVRAAQKGLYDGLEAMDTNAAITRDNAAQMVWNAMNAYEVEYKTTLVTDSKGQLTSQITVQDKVVGSNNDKITLLEDKYEAWTDVGTLSNIDGEKLTITMNAADVSASDYVNKDKNDKATTGDVTFSDLDKDYSALLGQKVKVLFKNGKTNDVIGVYATDDNNVLINTTASKLDTVSGETKIKVDGTKYSVDTKTGLSIWTISVDAKGNGKLTKSAAVTSAKDIYKTIDEINDNDMAVTVISNDNDSKVDVILVNQKSFVKLTTVNSSSVSYKAVQADMKGNVTGTAIKLDLGNDTPELYKGYAKDDYAFVGADLYNENLVFTKADTVTGKCESFKDDSIKLNGTWYDYILTGSNKYTAKSGKSYTAYVYGGYAYYLSGENGSSSDVDTLLVKTVGDYKKMDKGVETKVYFDDGKDAQVINVTKVVTAGDKFDLEDWDKDANDTANNCTTAKASEGGLTGLEANTLYAYEKDGSDYILFKLDNKFKSGDVKAYTSNVKYNDKSETINGMEAEDGAPIYLTYSNDTYKVIAGSALKGYKAMSGSSNSVYLADKNNVIAAYFNLGKDGISTTDTLYGVVKKAYKGTESNGTGTVVYLDLVTSEGIKTVETKETNVNSFSKGMIVSFTGSYEKANDDVEIVSNTAKNQTEASAKSQGYIAISNDWSDSSKLIRPYAGLFNGDTEVNVASAKVVSDSTVIYIDEDGYVVDEGTPSKAEELANANGYYANAFVIVNSDNEIDLLVYETSNRIKDGNNKEVQLTNKKATELAKDANNAKIADAIKALTDSDAKLAADNKSATVALPNVDGVKYTADVTTGGTYTGATVAVDGNTLTIKADSSTAFVASNTVKVTVKVDAGSGTTAGTQQTKDITLTLKA